MFLTLPLKKSHRIKPAPAVRRSSLVVLVKSSRTSRLYPLDDTLGCRGGARAPGEPTKYSTYCVYCRGAEVKSSI